MRQRPILGRNVPGLLCTRTISGGLCGKPGAYHVIWEERYALASIVCTDCLSVALDREHYQVHNMTVECGDIMASWYPEENCCRMPRDRGDGRAGRIIVDR